MATGCRNIVVFFCQRKIFYRVSLPVGLLVLLTAALTGCGEPKTPEQMVTERAEARWEALVAGDFETAYHFATPAYRAVVDAAGFQQRQGGQASWLGAQVRGVTCDPDVCEATVRLKINSPLPPRGSEIETDYTERWLLEDGEWWIFLKP